MSEQIRKEFENHPRFKGMDFRRSESHPEFYESPYANGAWDGYQAARPAGEKLPPSSCRQMLAAEGKPYPRSGCAVCGQLSPKWRECDSLIARLKP